MLERVATWPTLEFKTHTKQRVPALDFLYFLAKLTTDQQCTQTLALMLTPLYFQVMDA